MTLLEPLSFRTGLVAKNRIVLAPMTNQQSNDDGTLGDAELAWLVSRAKGGFGIVETCAAHVTKDGQGWPGELGIWNDEQLPGLTRLASSLHDAGAHAFVQIFHGGLRADPKVTGTTPWSAVYNENPPAREATVEDIARAVASFGDAAVRAEKAGFDGVEIHGAHGYLITQFLSSTNRRADAWGGSFEGRARFAREVTREVRRRTSSKFTVGIRLSPEDFGNAKGLDLDESIAVAKELADDGIDFLHLSLWRSAENTKKKPDAHPVTLFRKAMPADVRIVAAGSIWTRAEAEALLAKGADAVALGRSAIVNPSWPLDVASASWEPKRPPVTVAELKERALSEPFANYMRNWKGFVAD